MATPFLIVSKFLWLRRFYVSGFLCCVVASRDGIVFMFLFLVSCCVVARRDSTHLIYGSIIFQYPFLSAPMRSKYVPRIVSMFLLIDVSLMPIA